MQWRKLNPFQSLFGRILLWFWFTAVIIVFTTVFVTRQLEQNNEFQTLNEEESRLLEQLQERVERMASMPMFDIRRFGEERGGRPQRRGRPDFFLALINKSSSEAFFNKRIPPGLEKAQLIKQSKQSSAVSFQTEEHKVLGPVNIKIDDADYAMILVDRARQRTPAQRFERQMPKVKISLAIVISILLCFGLAWSLIKPIRQLQKASQALARGDIKARVGDVAYRGDELGELGRDFNAMAEQIESLITAQKRLLADVSHELRSPLARLQMAVGLSQKTSDEDRERHLSRLEKEANNIDEMVGNILRLSRLESDINEMHRETTNIGSLLQQVVDSNQYEAECVGKGIHLICNDKVSIKADQSLLSSIFDNLIRNALKYTQDATRIDVALSVSETELTIDVRDYGPGVPESELSKIFTPFYRTSHSRQRETGGTGLGLAIAERAVAAHGGSIEAQNAEGGGLCIRVRLPRS